MQPMEGLTCGFCGAGMVRQTQIVKMNLPKQKPGSKRRPKGSIPKVKREFLYCLACEERERAERRNRNTPAKWLSYIDENPLYFADTFGAADRFEICRRLLGRNGFGDVKRQNTRKHRRIYVQVAAL